MRESRMSGWWDGHTPQGVWPLDHFYVNSIYFIKSEMISVSICVMLIAKEIYVVNHTDLCKKC